MKTKKEYKIDNILKYETYNKLLEVYNYKAYNSRTAFYKDIKPQRLKLEIDGLTGIITAYKKGASYLDRWKLVRVRKRWVKELDSLINPRDIVGEIIYVE